MGLGVELPLCGSVDLLARVHGTGALPDAFLAMLVCTCDRWDRVTAKLICAVEASGILTSADLDELAALTGVAKSTMANKAALIRRMLQLGPLEPELCRRELLANHPYAWLVEIDGFIVDVRALPQALRDDARRRGLVPAWLGSTLPP